MEFKKKYDAIKSRFPNAKFCISCFKEIDEIENKILIENTEQIIYMDGFLIEKDKKLEDYFIIKRRDGEKHIYYKDVIDQIIDADFTRNICNHQYLETIRLHPEGRNTNSIRVCSSFWGS
jgi:hypothetical protein